MWTNVFKIGGFHQVSWFQFLPHESDLNPLPDKSAKLEQRDAATLAVLSSHIQLQKEGFLSTWTNSFVGPWDPSQGLHNPDEKLKLWLFLPGRNSSVVESAQAAVSRLRGIFVLITSNKIIDFFWIFCFFFYLFIYKSFFYF
ncbi:hypothetical protein CsSME_00004281 [Camellia sinensis var. sinensis]